MWSCLRSRSWFTRVAGAEGVKTLYSLERRYVNNILSLDQKCGIRAPDGEKKSHILHIAIFQGLIYKYILVSAIAI